MAAMAVLGVAGMAVLILAAGVLTAQDGWEAGSATFYGDMSGSETMQGACGYDVSKDGFGLQTAALSTALFSSGLTCGACFEIKCDSDPKWCAPGTISVTATNFCPPNPSKPNDDGGWCNPPRRHFDLSMPMFVKLVNDYHAGIIPVQFRRVPCVRSGGMRFELKGNPYWLLALVYNVGGAGDVDGVWVKGSNGGDWVPMSRNWGQNWNSGAQLTGQSLSFRVRTSDGREVDSNDVAPASWQLGQTFEGGQF